MKEPDAFAPHREEIRRWAGRVTPFRLGIQTYGTDLPNPYTTDRSRLLFDEGRKEGERRATRGAS